MLKVWRVCQEVNILALATSNSVIILSENFIFVCLYHNPMHRPTAIDYFIRFLCFTIVTQTL